MDYNKYSKDVHTIIDNLSKEESNHIGNGYWVDSNHIIYRKVEYVGNKPVGFIDVYSLPKFKRYGLIIIAVSKDARGKGIGKKLVNSAIQNCKNNKDIDKLRWLADSDNIVSINMAKSLGFKLNDDEDKKEFIYDLRGECITESCKDVETARKFLQEVDDLSKKYDANFFIVTDGASMTRNGRGKSEPAVKNARDSQIEWEKKNGGDPDEDWLKHTNESNNYIAESPDKSSLSKEFTNKKIEPVFDKILKLNDRLNDYEYMIPNNGNPITHIKNDDFIKYYVLLSPNEFEKYKGGVCWDYVAYEAMYFRAKYPNMKFETYYQVIDNRNDNPTHTFLIFEFNKKWYWFESSWKPNCGVYGFDNKSDCIEYIMQKLKLPGKNYGTYICKFDATDATMYGMNCVGYMNYMSFMIKPYKFTNKKIEPIFIYKGHCPTDSSHNKYYRVLYGGIGIYEAFKRIVPINVWLEFKKSTACKWLPLPPKYENNYYSYFTYEGYKKFMDLTYPKMLKYLNKDKIETSIVELDENSIVYSDKYQIVATNNNYMIESEDKSELIKGFKSKTSNVQYKTLSIDKPEIYDYLKNHFSKNNPMWEGVKDSKTYMDCFINGNNSRHIKRVGEIFINKANDEVIGFEVVEKPNNYLAIEIPDKKYHGYGFGKILLEDAIKKHGCYQLYVAKDNKVAIKMYKTAGFKIIKDRFDGQYWLMRLSYPKNITESTLSSKDRNSLPNSTFGIPSQRKFPLNDKAHVLAAIRMFNRVDREHEKELAHNIIKAMDKYGIKSDMVGKKNRLQTYLSDEDY